MKITSVSSVLLEPIPWVLIKVNTDEGITGLGEAYHGAGVHHIAVDARLTQRALIGQDPRNVDKLFRDMMSSMSASGFYQGAVMSAISGIEMALWDITGQALGVPISLNFGIASGSITTAMQAMRKQPSPTPKWPRPRKRGALTPLNSTLIQSPHSGTNTIVVLATMTLPILSM